MLLAALALALAAQDPAPTPPAEPAAELGALLAACREAAAIEATVHLVGEQERGPGEEPLLVADVRLGLRMARPCSGRLDLKGKLLEGREDGEPRYRQDERSVIGDGEALWLVDHAARSVRRAGASPAELGEDWPALIPLQAWAGIPLPPEAVVTRLSEPPEEGWRGFRVRLGMEGLGWSSDCWFDAQDRLRRCTLDPSAELQRRLREAGGEAIPRFRAEVRGWRLHGEADAAAWAAALPDGLRREDG